MMRSISIHYTIWRLQNKEEFTTRLDFTKNNAESHKHTLLMYK